MSRSQKHWDKSCLFRETFINELNVRKNGGVPSNVLFDNKGTAIFNGTNAQIIYKPTVFTKTKQYAFRVIFSLNKVNTSNYAYCFNISSLLKLSYNINDSKLVMFGGPHYVNGLVTNIATYQQHVKTFIEIVSVQTSDAFNLGKLILGSGLNIYYGNISMKLFEIYNRALSASEVQNLYSQRLYTDPTK